MTVTLESLASCFQGLIPAELFTSAADGTPNAAYLSHVDYVDDRHVALSFQFFNKSRRNIAENPQAQVLVLDPDTGQGWRLQLRYVRSEESGPLFDRMALRVEAIASYCGLKGVFKLRAADVYEVLWVAPVEEQPASPIPGIHRPEGRATPDAVFTARALQDLSERIHRAESLDELLDSTLEAIETSFGFRHSMILLPTEQETTLVAIATRGYREGGVGAEVRYGEGIVGMVAEARKPIRISGLLRGMLYAWAAAHAEPRGDGPSAARRTGVTLPGLPNPQSQLGVPLLVRGELVGVLCIESEGHYRFHEQDRIVIELLGSYLAIAIQNMQFVERAADPFDPMTPTAPRPERPEATAPVQPPSAVAGHSVTYYQTDECILVDGEYLIRSLPARILWKLLTTRESCGRTEFTNRELRLDKSLNLPEWKDNLEARLLLLRRRLEQKCPSIRLVPRARGRFALELDRPFTLETRP